MNPLEPWWFTTKAGKIFLNDEKDNLNTLLPSLYGYHLIQCAPPFLGSFVSSSLISHRVLINIHGSSNWPCSLIRSEMECLPLLNDSVDVVLLTHTLELVSRPHQMLREAHRALIAQGHVVITGLNPFSFWGILILIKRIFSRSPPYKMISPNRVKDWLKLLDFEIKEYKMFYYRPPFSNVKFMNRLQFFEKMGQRFWPFFGGGYVIVAVKKVLRFTPVRPRFIRPKKIWDAQGVTGSATYKKEGPM
ncbi:MAG TPA: methyltransferase domain-containing protein [Gammaproteobacteria bacterium]|nr:methyltransferase domain-containing protein [Gammaproteobacteria bacterium]